MGVIFSSETLSSFIPLLVSILLKPGASPKGWLLFVLFFEETYSEKPDFIALHPYYGQLNEELWRLLHTKHFAHHFEQFGI